MVSGFMCDKTRPHFWMVDDFVNVVEGQIIDDVIVSTDLLCALGRVAFLVVFCLLVCWFYGCLSTISDRFREYL